MITFLHNTIELTLIFIANSLFIFGLFTSTGEGMIFGFVQKWYPFGHPSPEIKDGDIYETANEIVKRHRNNRIRKPLFNCPPCMASIWGFAGFLFTGLAWLYLPVWIFCLAGFNYIVNKFVNK